MPRCPQGETSPMRTMPISTKYCMKSRVWRTRRRSAPCPKVSDFSSGWFFLHNLNQRRLITSESARFSLVDSVASGTYIYISLSFPFLLLLIAAVHILCSLFSCSYSNVCISLPFIIMIVCLCTHRLRGGKERSTGVVVGLRRWDSHSLLSHWNKWSQLYCTTSF